MPGKTAARHESGSRPLASREFLNRLDSESESNNFNYVDSAIAAAVNADTEDELFAALGATAGMSAKEDMVGVEHTVLSFEVNKGKYDFPYFLSVRAALIANGKEIEYMVGAPSIVILLVRLRDKDLLPVNVVIRSKAVSEGEMLYMEKITDRAIPLVVESEEPPF